MENEIEFKYIETAGYIRAILFPSFLIAVISYIIGDLVYVKWHVMPLLLYLVPLSIVSVIMYIKVGKRYIRKSKIGVAVFTADNLVLKFPKKELTIPFKSIYYNKRTVSVVFVLLDIRYNKIKEL